MGCSETLQYTICGGVFTTAGEGQTAVPSDYLKNLCDIVGDPGAQVSTRPFDIAVIDHTALLERDRAQRVIDGAKVSTGCADGFGPMSSARQANCSEIQWASHHHDIGAAINFSTMWRLEKSRMRRKAVCLQGVTLGQGALEKATDFSVIKIKCRFVVLLQRRQFFWSHLCHHTLSNRLWCGQSRLSGLTIVSARRISDPHP